MEKMIKLRIRRVKNGRSRDSLIGEGLISTSTKTAVPRIRDHNPAPLKICIHLILEAVLIMFKIVLWWIKREKPKNIKKDRV